jgi:hypothetical protein
MSRRGNLKNFSELRGSGGVRMQVEGVAASYLDLFESE